MDGDLYSKWLDWPMTIQSLNVKAEFDDVTIVHDVILTFHSHFAC
jgi:hypothetical protein